jgi:hypothetical protein
VPARRIDEADVGEAPGDPLHHLPPAERLFAIGCERDRVATFSQPLDRRLEEPQV